MGAVLGRTVPWVLAGVGVSSVANGTRDTTRTVATYALVGASLALAAFVVAKQVTK